MTAIIEVNSGPLIRIAEQVLLSEVAASRPRNKQDLLPEQCRLSLSTIHYTSANRTHTNVRTHSERDDGNICC
jgi:hypothetical protein